MSWLSLFRRARTPRPCSSKTLLQRQALKPTFEMLEDRCVPATFNVNTLADLPLFAGVNPATGAINGTNAVTLRSAIEAANLTPGGNTINLAVAGTYQIVQPPTNTNVVGVSITFGGSGFIQAPTPVFSPPNVAGGIQATGTAIVSNGVVVGVTITNPGSGYTSAPMFKFAGGNGAAGAAGAAIVGEDDNLAGEFAILPTGDLTIQNTSGGTVVVDGAGLSRVFDVNPNNTNNPATHFTVTLSGLTVRNGRAFDASNTAPDGPVASGGGIRVQGNQSLTLNNVALTDNSATADGGGIAMENVIDTPWTLTLNNCTVSNNHAGDAGGGVETDGSGRVNITGSVISGNTTVNQGAGIWLDAVGNDGAILTVTGSLVIGNTALNGPTGGIGNAGNTTFVDAAGNVTMGAVTIVGSTVADNFCGGAGGGFGDENNLGRLVVLNSTFVGNSATGSGGGISEGAPTVTINDSTITGNTSLVQGGGLYLPGGTRLLNNSVVAGNFSNGTGAMNFLGVAPDVFGAVKGLGNFIGIGDAQLFGITDGNDGNRVGTAANPLNPLLGALQNNGGPQVGAPGSQQVLPTESPRPGSPLIDGGNSGAVPTGTLTDQRGFRRLVGTSVDVGAVEFQPPATLTTLTFSAGSVALGRPVTLTATVAAASVAPNNVPTGTVTFFSGATVLGTATLDAAGTATLTISNEPGGVLSLTATYSGDTLFTPSTSPATQLNVVTPATTTTLTVTPLSVAFGRPVTFTATVTAAAGAGIVPTGTVTFFSGTKVLGTAKLDATGTATLTIANEPAGLLSITAHYGGDTLFTASTSAASLLRVFVPRTIGAFDPTTGTWYLANHTGPGAPDAGQFRYGGVGWFGLVGDWTGSGQTTVAVVDPLTETWYIRFSNTSGAPDLKFQFGAPGWIPIAGDWTGTGHFGIGVFDPNTGTFYLRNEVSAGGADAGVFQYGAPHWIPITGDWAGMGRTGIGVVDPTTETFYLRNTANAGGVDFTPFRFGAPGWKPVTGDWNGDGKTTVGVFDPNGKWYLRNSNTPGAPDITPFAYGMGGWTPVSGVWQVPAAQFQHAPDEGPGAAVVDAAALQDTVQAALTRLSDAGVAASLVDRLASAHYQLAALPAGVLGLTFTDGNEVLISDDAAGHGWFVDQTPLQDEEFAADGSALPGSAAAGREDLLTTVLHEMAHLAGLPDDNGSLLLADSLGLGVRRTDQLDAVFAAGA